MTKDKKKEKTIITPPVNPLNSLRESIIRKFLNDFKILIKFRIKIKDGKAILCAKSKKK